MDPHNVRRNLIAVSIRLAAALQTIAKYGTLHLHFPARMDVMPETHEWVSDITFFRYDGKNYYICVIIDLFARMVVGYRIGKRNSTQLVTRTFKAAYLQRSPSEGLLFHTDRGTNYRANAFEKCLKDHHVIHSFSRAYVPYDNSVMESFFSSMKREELYRTNYKSEREFLAAVDNYILFYNTKRPHAKNKYKTPAAKEQEFYMSSNTF